MYPKPNGRVFRDFLPFACADIIWGCDALALALTLTGTSMRDRYDVRVV
jgi:hypothetical protein